MTKAKELINELNKDFPATWAIDYASNLEDLPFNEKFEITLELAWNYGLHFDMRTAEYILFIPGIDNVYGVQRELAEAMIKNAHKVQEDVDDEITRLQELFGTYRNS